MAQTVEILPRGRRRARLSYKTNAIVVDDLMTQESTPSAVMLYWPRSPGYIPASAPEVWVSVQGLCAANERRRYKVTPSLIGWAQT